jgi:ABC-type thiamine transport system ATPase subunit
VIAPIQLSRVHARDRSAPGVLHEVTCMLEAGLHLFVGAPVDGSALICDVVAGRIRPRIGAVSVAGRDPATSPKARRHIGALLREPALPALGTVEETARWLGVGEAALSSVGARALADRSVRSLAVHEIRAVELAFALACREPTAVVLFEPFLAPVDVEAVRSRIADLSATCPVLVATTQIAEIEGMAPTVHVLDGGRLLREDIGWPRASIPEIIVWLAGSDAARRLAGRLALDPVVTSVSWQDDRVRLSASSLAAAGRAVAQAGEDLAIVALRPRLPSHDAIVVEARRRLDERLAARAALAGGPR